VFHTNSQSFRRIPRSGFTLVELLIVIAIIALLMALLFPAVQSAREAARRIQCANNMKQISTALLTYHDEHRKFPAGMHERIDELPLHSMTFWKRYSWYHDVLAYLEQQPLHDAYKAHFQALAKMTPTPNGFSYSNCPLKEVPVGTFMCPTQPGNVKNSNGAQTTNQQGFHGNYVLNAGNTFFNPSGVASSTSLNGLFMANAAKSIAHIRDGTSNTLLASELILVPDGPPGSMQQDVRGRYHNAKHAGVMFSTLYPPNTSQPDRFNHCYSSQREAPCTYTGTEVVVSARSYHVSGVNTSRADGSVHFVSDTVDDVAYRAMGSRAGGETTSSESH
jgi:prepilin-type N-terminal cleavage/methylation domain-containing protein